MPVSGSASSAWWFTCVALATSATRYRTHAHPVTRSSERGIAAAHPVFDGHGDAWRHLLCDVRSADLPPPDRSRRYRGFVGVRAGVLVVAVAPRLSCQPLPESPRPAPTGPAFPARQR